MELPGHLDDIIIDKIRKEEEEKSFQTPPSIKRSSIYPVYHDNNLSHITKIANSDLTSKFNVLGDKEILFGQNYIPYTIVWEPPHMNIKPHKHPKIGNNIDNDDIVYILELIINLALPILLPLLLILLLNR